MASRQYPSGQKPTMTEKVKEKMADMKDKLTGHDHHHTTAGTTATTTPVAGEKGESMIEKVKEKLPGHHGTTGHDPCAYEKHTGTTGYGSTGTATQGHGHEPTLEKELKDTVKPGQHHQNTTAGYGDTTGYGTYTGEGHEPTMGEKVKDKVTPGGNTSSEYAAGYGDRTTGSGHGHESAMGEKIKDAVTPGNQNTSGYTSHPGYQEGMGEQLEDDVMPSHEYEATHGTTGTTFDGTAGTY